MRVYLHVSSFSLPIHFVGFGLLDVSQREGGDGRNTQTVEKTKVKQSNRIELRSEKGETVKKRDHVYCHVRGRGREGETPPENKKPCSRVPSQGYGRVSLPAVILV